MGRTPCCDKTKVKRGTWSPEEDATLKSYLEKYGTGGNWISLPHKAGLKRCGKSCRLRWLNYLRPDIKHGAFTEEEDNIICTLYHKMGSRWSVIASQLSGRTDNDVKNHWNTKLKKKLMATITNSTSSTDMNKNNPSVFNPPLNISKPVPDWVMPKSNQPLNPSLLAMLTQNPPPTIPLPTDFSLEPNAINSVQSMTHNPILYPSEFGHNNAKGLTSFSPSREGSGISGSFSSLAVDNNCVCWSGNGGDANEGFSMEYENNIGFLYDGIWSC